MQTDSISIPLLATAGLAGAVLAMIVMAKFRAVYVVIGIMLFAASLGVAANWFGRVQQTWLLPVQMRRSEIFLGCGLLLWVAVLSHVKQLSFRFVPIQGIALLLIGLYAGLLRFYHEGALSGAMSLLFTLATVLPLLLILPALLREWADWRRMMLMIVAVNVFTLLAIALQFVLNHNVLILGRGLRFTGFTANPQHCGVLFSVFVVVAGWMALNDQRRYLLGWSILISINILFVFWTGSRTAMVMVVLGAMALFHRRMGRAVLLLPVAALLIFGLMEIAGSSVEAGLHRLGSTQDTRSHAFRNMLDSAKRNPLVGVGIDEAGDSENSFLYGFASYGIGAVGLMLFLVFVSGVQGIRLLRARSVAPVAQRPYFDFIIAYFAMYFAGSLVEGYLIARVASPLVLMLIIGSMATMFIKKANAPWMEAWNPEWDLEDDEALEAEHWHDEHVEDEGWSPTPTY